MKDFWENFFKFIKEVLPNLLLAFGVGKRVGEAGKEKVENELVETKLELGKLKNQVTVQEANSGKSDIDIVNDAISEGAKLKK
jgi:hypothetical protein